MASNATITINDGEATPVARSFTPQKIENGTAWFRDTSLGVPAGYGIITITRPKDPQDMVNGSARCVVELSLPKLETASGSTTAGFEPAPRLAYKLVARVELWLPVRSEEQDRKNLRVLLSNLFGHATVVSLIEDLEFVW